MTNTTLKSILKNQNTLVKLDLTDCKFPSEAVPIFSNLKNLEHLILKRVENFDVNEIFQLLTSVRN